MTSKKKNKINNQQIGMCALCLSTGELKLSHRIPKAVGALIKKNSFTKKLRSIHEPNVAVQDLDKEYMLCGECENRFSVKENLFMQKVLRPFRNDRNKKFDYESWLYYFIVSLSWRTLYDDSLDEEEFIKNGFSKKQYEKLKSTENLMREYLMGNSEVVPNIENHLIFLDESTEIVGNNQVQYSTYCNATFGYVFGNKYTGALYVFHVLAGILVITIIKKDAKDRYKNTYVKGGKGKFNKIQRVKSFVIESEILNHIPNQLVQAREVFSKEEERRLVEKIEKNPEDFLKSSSSISYKE